MNAKDFCLDFDGRVLTYHHAGGVTTYVGGYAPEFKAVTESVSKYTQIHQDPDYPIHKFSEELYEDENFWFDPVDCSREGVVLLCSGEEVLLRRLPKEKQDWAIRQRELTAFQQTVPYEIKERLLKVYCCRWAHYELFANFPAMMELFDENPDQVMKLARSSKRHSLILNPYV